MPRQRAVGSRSRGPWMARLSGLGAVVLIAGGGAATYVVEFHPKAVHHAAPLSEKVASNYATIGLIAQANAPAGAGGAGGPFAQILGAQGALAFSPLSSVAANGQGNGPWTANLMTDNTYIFIFVSNGKCLSAVASSATGSATGSAAGHAKLALQHCQVPARGQRWRRVSTALVEDGHDFYQYANVADGKCMAEVPGGPGQQVIAGLARCSKAHPASQLLAFWWLTV